MKKLLLGTISALAFLLGFASCSDDVHDVASPNVLYIGGGLAATENEVNTEKWPLKKVADPNNGTDAYEVKVNDDGTFELEFKYGKDNWGNPVDPDFATKISLLITAVDMSKSGVTWDGDINKQRWKSKDGEKIALNEDAKELESGADNAILSGLSVGNTYTIKGTVDGDKISLQVTQKFDPLNFYVIAEGESKNFPEADKDGKDILYLMTGASQKYSYQFIAADDETFKVTVFNGITGASDVSDAMTVKQDRCYKIEYTLGGKPTLAELSMLVDAEVISNAKHADDFFKEADLSGGTITLSATRGEFQFYINRTAGDSSLSWGNKDITLSNTEFPVALDYKKDGKPAPCTLKGLVEGTSYVLEFKETDGVVYLLSVEDVSLYIGGGLAATENEVDTVKWPLKKVADPLNGSDAYKVKLNTDGTFELEFKYGKNGWGDPDESDFATKLDLLITAVDMSKPGVTWNGDINKQRWSLIDDTIALNEEAKKLEMNNKNVTLSGLTVGKKYIINGTLKGNEMSMSVKLAE